MRTTTPRGALAAAAVLVALVAGVFHAGIAEARAWLGVYTQEVTDELRDGLDLRGADGVLVARVVPGSPADRAGLRKGDVIVSFASRGVTTPDRLSELVGDAQSGESVSIIVMRDGERRTLSARLDSRPEDGTPAPSVDDDSDDEDSFEAPAPPRAPRAPRAPGEAGRRRIEIRVPEHEAPSAPGKPKVRTFTWNGEGDMPEEIREHMGDLHLEGLEGLRGLQGLEGLEGLREVGPGGKHLMLQSAGRGRLGVRVQALDSDMASALGAPGTKGVVVLEVLGGTPAEKAGLRAGDILTSVDGTAVYEANDLVKALANKDGAVSLSVTRRGARQTVRATLQETRRATRLRSGPDQLGLGRTGDRRVVRLRDHAGTDREGLRQELDELREQVRELRQHLEESRR